MRLIRLTIPYVSVYKYIDFTEKMEIHHLCRTNNMLIIEGECVEYKFNISSLPYEKRTTKNGNYLEKLKLLDFMKTNCYED